MVLLNRLAPAGTLCRSISVRCYLPPDVTGRAINSRYRYLTAASAFWTEVSCTQSTQSLSSICFMMNT